MDVLASECTSMLTVSREFKHFVVGRQQMARPGATRVCTILLQSTDYSSSSKTKISRLNEAPKNNTRPPDPGTPPITSHRFLHPNSSKDTYIHKREESWSWKESNSSIQCYGELVHFPSLLQPLGVVIAAVFEAVGYGEKLDCPAPSCSSIQTFVLWCWCPCIFVPQRVSKALAGSVSQYSCNTRYSGENFMLMVVLALLMYAAQRRVSRELVA
ncbi:unnamed protein product [Urochloa humidicola]